MAKKVNICPCAFYICDCPEEYIGIYLDLAKCLDDELPILEEYCNLAEVFSKRESYVLLPHHPMDYTNEIMLETKLLKPNMYSMTPREMKGFRGFIEKNLARGFSQPAKSMVTALMFFREKKDGFLRMFGDKCHLHGDMQMKDMLGYLSKGKIFTKLDLRETYYQLRIKEGDE